MAHYRLDFREIAAKAEQIVRQGAPFGNPNESERGWLH
jgi:deferrochelatase/peroxidase EfeB